ncbi:MAG: nitrilase [Blastocatellia bacterium]|nr:nitrilase [Blastocatellia bacterium]
MDSFTNLTAYRALALQAHCVAVNRAAHRAEAFAVIHQTIERLARQIAASLAFIGSDVRLVVLPEYFLTGFPLGETIPAWMTKACLDMNGPEYEALGRIAQDNRIFLAGNAYETDPHFPALYFQTSFILSPAGDMVLRYRRLNSMFAPTPHDVWNRYLDRYGWEGVFPVAQTEIGNLAAIASEEILFPEIARCLAMRGAEIFVHSTSDIAGDERSAKEVTKIARAVENLAFVVSANSAGISGTDIPVSSTDGGSKIIDYRGLVLSEAGQGESLVAFAEIDLAALRRYRQRPGMANLLSRQRFELYAESYGAFSFYPPNSMEAGTTNRSHFRNIQQQVIEKLTTSGVFKI